VAVITVMKMGDVRPGCKLREEGGDRAGFVRAVEGGRILQEGGSYVEHAEARRLGSNGVEDGSGNLAIQQRLAHGLQASSSVRFPVQQRKQEAV
jgi:hypothetical protein